MQILLLEKIEEKKSFKNKVFVNMENNMEEESIANSNTNVGRGGTKTTTINKTSNKNRIQDVIKILMIFL